MGQSTVVCTSKPIVAGILSIICGAVEIWGGLFRIADHWSQLSIYAGVVLSIIGLVAIAGGILALRRRVWWLALTGTICALLGSILVPWMLMWAPPLPPGATYSPGWVWIVMIGMPMLILGILAIVLIASSKQEFR